MPRRLIPMLLLAAAVAVPAWPVAAGGADPVDTQIVGGTEADPGEYPFAVALIRSPFDTYADQFCGGALIDPSWVVTAAHCVRNLSPSNIKVYANDHDLRGDGDMIEVAAVVVHEDFRSATLEADIALLALVSPATAPRALGDVILYASEDDAARFDAGTEARVVGWGHTESFPAFPERLREVDVPIRSDAACDAAYGAFYFTPDMLCAGYDAGGKDSCSGDSGGPLFVDTGRSRSANPAWLLVGVVSWGFGCADPGDYGVYARVATFSGWIEDHSGVVSGGCLGFAPTLVGTPRDDVLYGTDGDDVIVAGTGDDRIVARAGDDLICADQGDDVVRAGHGDDIVLAGPGQDRVFGGNGRDMLVGGNAPDLLSGGRGADEITGSGGDDTLKGGMRRDDLDGGAGDDRILGNGEDDHLDGGIGQDRLVGGPGSDTCADGESMRGCEFARLASTELR
jgi:trypsin